MAKTSTKSRGPAPERLALDGDWKSNVAKALKKKRPDDGWPKPRERDKRRPTDG